MVKEVSMEEYKSEWLQQLQQLFREPIERITYLDPGYSGHASDVWLVKTAREERIVRSSRWNEAPTREFWWGVSRSIRNRS